jgi:hypothetical protein
MSDIDFSVQVISDKFQEFRTNSSASASKVIARVLSEIEKGPEHPNDYKVLIAYQLLMPELSLDQLFQSAGEKMQLEDRILAKMEEIGVKSGYYIIFVKPSTALTKLEINIKGKINTVVGQDFLVGRKDDIKGIFPDLDLSQYLDEGIASKVSRELLVFREVDGKWKVKLHPNARSSVFLDSYKLEPGDEVDIGASINVGNSPEEPYIKLITKVRVE